MMKFPYITNHEYSLKKVKQLKNKLTKKGTLLDNRQTKALRRDISTFLDSNYDFFNSTSKYHLKTVFTRVIRKIKWLESNENGRKGGKGEKRRNKNYL